MYVCPKSVAGVIAFVSVEKADFMDFILSVNVFSITEGLSLHSKEPLFESNSLNWVEVGHFVVMVSHLSVLLKVNKKKKLSDS
jgi:uncharacterized membrane protein